MRLRAGLFVLCASFFAVAKTAHADLPSTRGAPITTSDYKLDLYQGPVLASARVTALAGAYTAIAEGAEGIPFNPAAASMRMPYSTTNVDYDLTGGLTFSSSFIGIDFDNNGDKLHERYPGIKLPNPFPDIVFINGGGLIQYGHAAIGIVASAQFYTFDQSPFLRLAQPPDATGKAVADKGTDTVDGYLIKAEPVVSYGFLDDQLHVGMGLRIANFSLAGNLSDVDVACANVPPNSLPCRASLAGNGTNTQLFSTTAVGFESGALWAPYALPLRVGATVRSPSFAGQPKYGGGFTPDAQAGGLHFPKEVGLPWELEGGVAVQLWKRPLNIQWEDEDKVPDAEAERWRRSKRGGQIEPSYKGARRMLKQRYQEIPREKVLLTTSILLSGPVDNAVSVNSMLSGLIERSGESTSIGVRGGVEAEVIPYWLVLRGGSYLEPSRFSFSSPRLHGTAGVQVRLFRWDVFGALDDAPIWRISTVVDVARDYFSWGAGVGMFM